jgi:peptide/nickel transport system substrate-binding protein
MEGAHMKKAFLPLAILLIVIMVFTGCGKASTTSTSTGPIDKGGTLRFLIPYSPATTPGWTGDRNNPQVLWMNWSVFEPLVRLQADGSPEAWLAKDWTWGDANKLSITFKLRNDVSFSDGTKFTAEAVKLQADQNMSTQESNTVTWDKWVVNSDYSITLFLKKYMTDFWLNVAATNMMFVSPTVLKQGVAYTGEHPVGTGPFLFKSFDKDVSLKLTKNPSYWQKGKPYLDGIEFTTVKESITAGSMMEANEGDMLALQQGKILKDMQDAKLSVVTQYGGTNFLVFDTANEASVYNDKNIRMAIEYAINKQEMADALGYGFLVVNNQLSPPDNPGFNAAIGTRDYNPTKARELLAAAGYTDNLKLKVISDSNGQNMAVYLQNYLKAVGVTLELEMVDNAKLWNYIMGGWNDAIINVGYAIGQILPAVIKSYFPPTGIFDKSSKIPANIIAKLDPAMSTSDPKQAKALSDEIAQMLYDDCTFVPLFSNAMGYILKPSVQDSGIFTYSDYSIWNASGVWIKK